MKTLYSKTWLIETLLSNREKHHGIFLKALEGYRKVALERFEKNIALIKEGKWPESYINFTVPVDKTKEYDKAISMLERTDEQKIELNETDFAKFVLDQWDWKNQFITSNSTYTKIDGEADEG